MLKWYDDLNINNEIAFSNRIRLARNLKKYPFFKNMNEEKCNNLIDIIKKSIINDRTYLKQIFNFINILDYDDIDKLALVEKHIASNGLINKKMPSAILLQKDEKVSIMINEEDHIRIQSINSGLNIDVSFEIANKFDDLIEESVEYAFDKDYGYLTSCITNVGTGLRASFMIHIPMIEKFKQLTSILKIIGKHGVTLRGIYGEGSKSIGGIYQISNQITLGKTEYQILENIKNVTNQIIEKEKQLRLQYINENKIEFYDEIYRAYGLLSNCKKISLSEAMINLSKIWIGIYNNVFEDKYIPKKNIYNIMINIQPANLIKYYNNIENIEEIDMYRAKYINKMFQ